MRRGRFLTAAAAVLAMTVALVGCGKATEMTPADAQAYAQACLDASYKGELDAYMELTGSSEAEAQALYDSGIENTMYYAGLEEAGISQGLQDQYRQLFIDLYKSARYTLQDPAGDMENGFTVTCTCEPFLIFDTLETDMITAMENDLETLMALSEDELNEYTYQLMYDLMTQKMDAGLEYGDPEEVTLHISPDENGVFQIDQSDLTAVENALVP